MLPSEQPDDAVALEQKLHAAQFAAGLIQFARMTAEHHGKMDVKLVLSLLLVEALADLHLSHGIDADVAFREAQSQVQQRIASQEKGEIFEIDPPRPSSLH